jgi:DNA-binding NarL/FixJ family response regulator
MITRTPPLRILLVDDEKHMQLFVGQALRMSITCEIVAAHNGEEGVAHCQANDPELIILDIHMPRMDGVKALEEIRKLKPDTPVVMLTSVSEEAVVESCLTLGASYFIRKDVRAGLLRTELEAMLQLFFPDEQAPNEQSTTP